MKNTRAEFYLDLFNDVERVELHLLNMEYAEFPDDGDEDRATDTALGHVQAAKVALLDAVKAAVVADIEES